MEKRKRSMRRYGLGLTIIGNVHLEARLPFVPVASDEELEREKVEAIVKAVFPKGSWVDDFDVTVNEVVTEEDVKPKGRRKAA
jgi:hypothetical protein